jgi:hypothetical protein
MEWEIETWAKKIVENCVFGIGTTQLLLLQIVSVRTINTYGLGQYCP